MYKYKLTTGEKIIDVFTMPTSPTILVLQFDNGFKKFNAMVYKYIIERDLTNIFPLMPPKIALKYLQPLTDLQISTLKFYGINRINSIDYEN